MCISARDDSLSWPMQMSSQLAIICGAAKKLLVFPRLSPFKTSLSPRMQGNALSITEKNGF